MRPTLLFCLLLFVLLYGCQQDNNDNMRVKKNIATADKLPGSVIIAPVYPDTVYFVVQANIRKRTIVNGDIEGFHNSELELNELYFQRFVEKQGTYRVIHCVGVGLETINEFGKEKFDLNNFNDTIKFDELGIFEGEPGDPVDLVPLYPGKPVKTGEFWYPEAQVKIAMGSGIAKYSFVIDSLFRGEEGSLLARLQIKLNGDLQPVPEFAGGNVNISGGGWILWDCTINQRRETHLKATYHANNGKNYVKQFITVDDKLQVTEGRKEF